MDFICFGDVKQSSIFAFGLFAVVKTSWAVQHLPQGVGQCLSRSWNLRLDHILAPSTLPPPIHTPCLLLSQHLKVSVPPGCSWTTGTHMKYFNCSNKCMTSKMHKQQSWLFTCTFLWMHCRGFPWPPLLAALLPIALLQGYNRLLALH